MNIMSMRLTLVQVMSQALGNVEGDVIDKVAQDWMKQKAHDQQQQQQQQPVSAGLQH